MEQTVAVAGEQTAAVAEEQIAAAVSVGNLGTAGAAVEEGVEEVGWLLLLL